jgi:hypothetical protein
MAKPTIKIAPEGANGFKFVFQDEYTKITGRTSAWTGAPKPGRSAADKLKMAKTRIAEASKAFAAACKVEL